MSKLQTLLIGKGALFLGCAEILVAKGCGISAVVSSDKDIKSWATKAGVKQFEDDQLSELATQVSEFDILLSIGNFNIIPDSLLQSAKRMSINYHYGPLPEYSGLHAPSWAVYNRATSYDICWHKIDGEIDSGNILKRMPVAIQSDDTALQLELKCTNEALAGFSELVDELENGEVNEIPQDQSRRHYYSQHSQFPAEGFINWNTDAQTIDALVRATNYGPFDCPLAWPKLVINNTVMAVRAVTLGGSSGDFAPGQIVVNDKTNTLSVATLSTLIELTQLSSLDGRTLPIEQLIVDEEISSGMSLDSPDSKTVETLEATGLNASKSTAHWIEALRAFDPYRLPHIVEGNSAHSVHSVHSVQSAQSQTNVISLPIPITDQSLTSTNLTLSEFLVGAWCTFLARASQTSNVDIAFGRTVAELNATYADAFASWVPLATKIDASAPASVVLEQIAESVRSINEHGLIRRDLTGRTPDLQQKHAAGSLTADIKITINSADVPPVLTTEYSPALQLNIDLEQSQIDFHFNSQKLSPDQVSQLSAQFSHWCSTLTSSVSQPLDTVPVLTTTEQTLLDKYNNTNNDSMSDQVFTHLFDQAAMSYADSDALLCGDNQLSYSQLSTDANQLACFLCEKGIGRGDRVGVCLDRCSNSSND